METVSEICSSYFVLNNPLDGNKILSTLSKDIDRYFSQYPNDGNNILVISIKRINDEYIKNDPRLLEYKGPNLQNETLDTTIN